MNKISKSHITAAVVAVVTMGFASGSALAGGFLDLEFVDDATFDTNAPSKIHNPYWPLNPDGGNTPREFTYTADTEDECVENTVYVNGGPAPYYFNGRKTVTVGGKAYETLEVLDIEWVSEVNDDDECDEFEETEVTLDWYAQDDNGNIWYMGELSMSFEEEGCEIDDFNRNTPTYTDNECYEGSWEAGVENGDPEEPEEAVTGQPGIVVPSDTPFGNDTGELLSNGTYYFQEIAFEAEDMAKVLKLSTSLSVEDGIEPGEYDECRKVKEWNPYEPGESVEHKWYCKGGNGLVLIEGIGGGPTEVETLVEVGP